MPLVVSKASTIHGLQGVTVGPGRSIERLRILWEKEHERLSAGLFYVAVSRAKEVESLAFDEEASLDDESLGVVSTSEDWKTRHAKHDQVLSRASRYREQRMGERDPDSKCLFASKEDLLFKIECLVRTSRHVVSRRMEERQQGRGGDSREYVAEIEQCLAQWEDSARRMRMTIATNTSLPTEMDVEVEEARACAGRET